MMRVRRAYDGALALALAVSVLLFIVPQFFSSDKASSRAWAWE
jgi:hypothetical protein